MDKWRLQLNRFIEEDINTFYYINGLLERTYTVEHNPNVLLYPVDESECGKSADQLFDQALDKVSWHYLLYIYR